MLCPGCGNNVSDGSSFCNFCGGTLATAGADVASPVSIAQPPVSVPPPSEPKTSGKSIASLLFGCFFFLFPSAILAIVFGHLSLSEIGKSAGRIKGKGIAITGLVLGYLGVSFIPILIIAAIAIPNLLRARIAANESSAVTSVRTLNTAEIAYATQHPKIGYVCSLSDLRELIDSQLASGQKYGYAFEIAGCTADPTSGAMVKYQVAAHPLQYNQTGMRTFCSDESAVIRVYGNDSAQNCLENGAILH